MTPAQVKRILRQNKRAGIPPWSCSQLATLYGASRTFVSFWMNKHSPSAPFSEWLDIALVPPSRLRPEVRRAAQLTDGLRRRRPDVLSERPKRGGGAHDK